MQSAIRHDNQKYPVVPYEHESRIRDPEAARQDLNYVTYDTTRKSKSKHYNESTLYCSAFDKLGVVGKLAFSVSQ